MSVKKHKVTASAVHWLDCSCNAHLQNGDMKTAVEWMVEHGGGPVPLKVVYEAVTDSVVSAGDAETYAARQLLIMAGVDSLVEACENWDAERHAMREMQSVNNDLRTLNRRLQLIFPLVLRYLDQVDKQGALFLPPSAKKMAADIREQISKLKVPLTISKEIVEGVE